MPIPNDDETEVSTEPQSRREALEAAMNDLEAGAGETAETEAPVTAPAEGDAGEPQTAAERARDEAGRFAKAEAEKKPDEKAVATPPARPAPGAPAAPPAAAAQPGQAPAAPTGHRAPQSWKPAVREQFGALPAEVQAEVLRRERDATRMAQELAQARQAADGFGETLRPFENGIRARGQDPRQFVGSLLQTEHALSTAPPAQKAMVVAQLCATYGIEPQHLDQALVAMMSGQGGRAPQMAQQAPQQQFRDPRVDQLLAQAEQRSAESASQLAETFSSGKEFFEDVREEVADILEMWARRGKREVSNEDLDRAYTLACQSNPDVAPVFEQRRAAEQAAKARASTQRARAAGVSLRSTPGASTAAVTPDKASGARVSRREALAQAMDAAESGGGRV